MKANILEPCQLRLFDIPIPTTDPKVVKEYKVIEKLKSCIYIYKIIQQYSRYLAIMLKKSNIEFGWLLIISFEYNKRSATKHATLLFIIFEGTFMSWNYLR